MEKEFEWGTRNIQTKSETTFEKELLKLDAIKNEKTNVFYKANKTEERAIYYYQNEKIIVMWIKSNCSEFKNLTEDTVLDLFKNI